MTTTARSTPYTDGVAPEITAELDRMQEFLRTTLASSGQQRFVIGLSGGIDSAVVAHLAVRAVGAERVMLVRMPYGLEASSRFASSTPASLADAQRVIDELPDVAAMTVDIGPMVDGFASALEAVGRTVTSRALDNPWDAITAPANAPVLGNLKARARAVTLRALANSYKGLVLGTENRTEHLLGYFTIDGDASSDLEVLSPFYKRDVRAFAVALGVVREIRDKAPSADLWTGQTDENELGFSYEDADRALDALDRFARSHRVSPDVAANSGVIAVEIAWEAKLDLPVVTRIIDRVRATAFKRAAKPTYARPTPLA